MKIFKDESAKPYKSPKLRVSADEARARALPFFPFSPFEILGESVVPNNTTVPAILQGTFIQVTNLDVDKSTKLLMLYGATSPFNYGPSENKVVLAANFIDGSLNVFDFTADFKAANFLVIDVPPKQTFIVGIQYLIDPKAKAGPPPPAGKEALGNRGYVALVPNPGTGFLVTTTIRQVFLSSFATPQNIISSTAYSASISSGPIVNFTPGSADLLA